MNNIYENFNSRLFVNTTDMNIFISMLNDYLQIPYDKQFPIDDIFLDIVESKNKNAIDKLAIILEKSIYSNKIFWKTDTTYADAIESVQGNEKILNYLTTNRELYEFNL